MKSLPVLVENVTLSLSSVARDIYPLIRSIRPDWTDSNTRLVKFTEGITNAILGLFDSRTPDDDQQALVIKLFGAHTELFIDRQSELNSMIALAEQDVLAQRVLVQFNNGIIYQYAPGQPCSREQVRQENIARLIATKLAHFHSVPVQHKEKPYLTSLLRQFLRLLDDHGHSSAGFSLSLVSEE
jgi:thiamine kinase-like enzyme